MKKNKNQSKKEEAWELYHNQKLLIKELAIRYGKSERTMYRWIRYGHQEKPLDQQEPKKKRKRTRKYPPEVFSQIIDLKKGIPQRSAPAIWMLLKNKFLDNIPSISTIRKYIREQGLTYKRDPPGKGYVKFEREQPIVLLR